MSLLALGFVPIQTLHIKECVGKEYLRGSEKEHLRASAHRNGMRVGLRESRPETYSARIIVRVASATY